MTIAEYKTVMFQLKSSLNSDGLKDDRIQRLYDGLMFMCDEYEKLQQSQVGAVNRLAELLGPAVLTKGGEL